MNISETSMNQFLGIFDNAVLAWGLIACGIAQSLKLVFELILNREWRPSILLETGGMPSSHSALVTGTAAGVGWELGFDHAGFALAVAFAFVVMYDASGIRKAAGLTSKRVNLLTANVLPQSSEANLKETLGHTTLEVFIGSLIGPTVALVGIYFIGSPLDIIISLGFNLG